MRKFLIDTVKRAIVQLGHIQKLRVKRSTDPWEGRHLQIETMTCGLG